MNNTTTTCNVAPARCQHEDTIVLCDGTFHQVFCQECNCVLSTEACPEAGTFVEE